MPIIVIIIYCNMILNRLLAHFLDLVSFTNAVAIRTGTVRRVWFAIRTAMGIFLAIVGEIFVFFDFYNTVAHKCQRK